MFEGTFQSPLKGNWSTEGEGNGGTSYVFWGVLILFGEYFKVEVGCMSEAT